MNCRRFFAGLFGGRKRGATGQGRLDMNHVNRYEHQRYVKALAAMSEAELEAVLAEKTDAEKVIFRYQVGEFRRYGFLPYVAGGPGRKKNENRRRKCVNF